ncbi:MAG TPA: Uma2 family endonuclease [Bacteroidetes bacterium]|nr:Uma2 family endonuclease [Bacteroidota bacterium]
MLVLEKKMTWKEFRELEIDDNDKHIYELIGGIPIRRTSPGLKHQRIARRLSYALGNFLETKPLGEYFYALTDVYFDNLNGLVPDGAFISKDKYSLLENDEYIAGPPDIIIEIISPGTVKRDRVEKKNICEKFAVKEYWLIDPANKTVEIFAIKNNVYELQLFLEIKGKLTSGMLPGFEMDVEELFD